MLQVIKNDSIIQFISSIIYFLKAYNTRIPNMYDSAYKLYDRIIFDQLEAFDLTKKNWKFPFT